MDVSNELMPTRGLMTTATTAVTPTAEYGQDQVDKFNQLIFAGTPSGEAIAISPEEALSTQIAMTKLTVGVDLGAKVAGTTSQSFNKLTNMT